MKEVKINNVPTVPEFYKLSGERIEKDHHPHNPKTTFGISSVAVGLMAAVWIFVLLFITTWVFRWN